MASSKQLSNLEISSFCSQMTMLLRAGIAPAEGVRILLSDTTDSDGKAILQNILDVCMQGESFYKAITAAGVFPAGAGNRADPAVARAAHRRARLPAESRGTDEKD